MEFLDEKLPLSKSSVTEQNRNEAARSDGRPYFKFLVATGQARSVFSPNKVRAYTGGNTSPHFPFFNAWQIFGADLEYATSAAASEFMWQAQSTWVKLGIIEVELIATI